MLLSSIRQAIFPKVKGVALNVGICYFAFLATLFFVQEKLIFIGSMQGKTEFTDLPKAMSIFWLPRKLKAGVYQQQATNEEDDDQARFRVATVDPTIKGGEVKGVVVFFGGNAEDLGSLLSRCAEFARYGLLAYAGEPPGYGESAGPLHVDTFMLQAEVIGRHARARATELNVPLFVVGSSLGTFSAVHVAAKGYGDRLLLHAPLTSLMSVAQRAYWYVPVSYALRTAYQFDSVGGATTIGERRSRAHPSDDMFAMIIHGDSDGIVPQEDGKALAELMGPQATFVDARGFGHNDIPLNPEGPFGVMIEDFFFP